MISRTLIIVIFCLFVGVKFCCGFIYTGNSAYGIFVAIAVPLNIPHRNIFVSYNFEANYNLPADAQTIIPGPYQRFTPLDDLIFGENINNLDGEVQEMEEVGRKYTLTSNNETTSEKPNNPKPLITRRAVYQILSEKLKVTGFGGKSCLLKLICEVNASLLGKNNGVFGSILHILLTPSTSSFENLPNKFYKAEENGVNGNCFQYQKNCPHDIMDIFSVPIEDLFKII